MVKADRPARYGGLAILLHWLTLLLVILIYLTIELHELVPPENRLRGALEDWHVYLGFVLLPIAIVRLLNIRRKPAPPVTPALSAWQATLTGWMKNYLYVLLIGTPLSGWVFLSADGAMINVWAFPLPSLVPENQGLAQLAEGIHVLLGLSGYVFITIHALAALFHHYLMKDNTLTRILPRFLVR
jgi:cytochrome b561